MKKLLAAIAALCVISYVPASGTTPTQQLEQAVFVPDPPSGILTCDDIILTGGQATTINYSNPAFAGETVVIVILGSGGEMTTIEIDLDEDGDGSTSWVVPANWTSATFEGPVDEEINRIID